VTVGGHLELAAMLPQHAFVNDPATVSVKHLHRFIVGPNKIELRLD
jgi:hypothetical protein